MRSSARLKSALPQPDSALAEDDGALARLWQAATILREHRGDGHFAALTAAGTDGCEVLVLRCALLVLVWYSEKVVRVQVGIARGINPGTEIVVIPAHFEVEVLIEPHAAHVCTKFKGVIAADLSDAVRPLERIPGLR